MCAHWTLCRWLTAACRGLFFQVPARTPGHLDLVVGSLFPLDACRLNQQVHIFQWGFREVGDPAPGARRGAPPSVPGLDGEGLLQDHCLGHLFRLRRPGWVLSSFPCPAVCLGCGTGTLPRPFWGCRGPWACPGITRVPFPAEPSFVFADVMRESPGGGDGGDDRVYFFFTEVSVEYEFVFKLLIPRVARVCKVSASPPFPPRVQPLVVARHPGSFSRTRPFPAT